MNPLKLVPLLTWHFIAQLLVVPSLYLEGSKSWWSLIFFRLPFCNCFNCSPWWINSLVFHPQVKWNLFRLYFTLTQWLFVVFNLNLFQVDSLWVQHTTMLVHCFPLTGIFCTLCMYVRCVLFLLINNIIFKV